MDGTPGYLSKELFKVVEKLKTISGIEIITWDERLTSVEGERIAKEIGKRDKKLVDKIAATLILQSYLDYINRTNEPSNF